MFLVDQQTFEITVDAGDQDKVKFTLTNSDGTPFNATGATFEFTAKSSLDVALASAELRLTSAANPSQFDLSGAATGIVVVEFTAANTSALGGRRYYYGLKMTEGSGKVHTPRVAFLIVRKNPTL
jgi:hypothetical protein